MWPTKKCIVASSSPRGPNLRIARRWQACRAMASQSSIRTASVRRCNVRTCSLCSFPGRSATSRHNAMRPVPEDRFGFISSAPARAVSPRALKEIARAGPYPFGAFAHVLEDPVGDAPHDRGRMLREGAAAEAQQNRIVDVDVRRGDLSGHPKRHRYTAELVGNAAASEAEISDESGSENDAPLVCESLIESDPSVGGHRHVAARQQQSRRHQAAVLEAERRLDGLDPRGFEACGNLKAEASSHGRERAGDLRHQLDRLQIRVGEGDASFAAHRARQRLSGEATTREGHPRRQGS